MYRKIERITYNIFLYVFALGSGIYAGIGVACSEPVNVKMFCVLPAFIVCLLVVYFSSKFEGVDDVTLFVWCLKD